MKKLFTALALLTSTHLFAQPFIEWAKNIGGTEIDISQQIIADSDGNVYVTGYFSEVMDVDPGAGTSSLNPLSSGTKDIFLLKYDASGNLIWSKVIGGSGAEEAYAITIDDSANLYLGGIYWDNSCDLDPTAGTTTLPYSNGPEVFFAKYDSSGALIWAKGINGPGSDDLNAITLDSQGNIIIVGSYQGTVDFDPSAATNNETVSGAFKQTYIAKYDNGGNYLWSESAGSSTDDDEGFDVVTDASDNVIACGYITLSNNESIWLGKYNSAGVNTFSYIFTTAPSSYSYANSVTVDDSSRIYITGRFRGTVDLDPSSGSSLHTNSGDDNIFLASYLPSGTLNWSRSFGAGSNDNGVSVQYDDNAVYLGGYFFNTVDFDLNAGTSNITSNGVKDAFIAKYDLTSNLIWAGKLGGATNDELLFMDVRDGYVYVTGWHTNGDFDPGTGIYNLTGFGACDIFMGKYSSDCPAITLTVNQSGATLTATTNGTQFQWLDCANSYAPVAGATSTVFTATANGNYAIMVTNAAGCSDTSSCFTVSGLSIEDNNSVMVTLYPNPTTHMLQLNLESDSPVLFTIYDMSGRMLMTGQYHPHSTLDVSGLVAGSYVMFLTEKNVRLKFLKR